MRYLIVIFMIVLLPLRGWAGETMATRMASSEIASELGALSVQELGEKASFAHKSQLPNVVQAMPDCHDQLNAQAALNSPTHDGLENDPCGTCQACQACHTLALSPSPLAVTATFMSSSLRPARTATFTSAVAALGQKPPIS